MTKYLLDTNTFIYIRQRRPMAARARFEQLASGDMALSVVTLGELAYGVERSVNRTEKLRDLRELTNQMVVLPLPAEAGETYGAFRASLGRRGETIGNNDLWIAAHAHVANLILVTNNEREFARIPELTIENWTR